MSHKPDNAIVNPLFHDKSIPRRRFLQLFAYSSISSLGLTSVGKAAIDKDIKSRTLSFANTHTGENLSVTYFEEGRYLGDAMQEINNLLRDHRTGDVYPIDPALLNKLHLIYTRLDSNKPFQIISGYRSPYTNALLHKSSSSVAKKSLHMLGKAIDIRVEGVDSRYIRKVAIAMGQGGVGYYQRSDFVHLDTGRFRTW